MTGEERRILTTQDIRIQTIGVTTAGEMGISARKEDSTHDSVLH